MGTFLIFNIFGFMGHPNRTATLPILERVTMLRATLPLPMVKINILLMLILPVSKIDIMQRATPLVFRDTPTMSCNNMK